MHNENGSFFLFLEVPFDRFLFSSREDEGKEKSQDKEIM
jgi:hypothetical protein